MDSGAVDLLHEVHVSTESHVGGEILIVDVVPEPLSVPGLYALFGEVSSLLREVRRIVLDVSAGMDRDRLCPVVAEFDSTDLFEIFI